MKIITTNLLNRFWKNGVKPIKDALDNKIDTSKIVNNLLTTAAGYVLDARQGKVLQDQISKLNTNIEKITYPYNTLNDVRLYGFVSKKQMDVTGTAVRYIVFIPTMAYSSRIYGVKTIKEMVVQGVAILRQDGKNINGFTATNATQTNQGIVISIEWSSETPDISGYICDCVFDFFMVN